MGALVYAGPGFAGKGSMEGKRLVGRTRTLLAEETGVSARAGRSRQGFGGV